jgi:hypothetical protein
MLNDEEIKTREPIWLALSELWLDTELTERDLNHIASVMAGSKYSLGQLRDIYLYEVAPVLYTNLLNVAGEWAGFDEAWLFRRIKEEVRRSSPARRFLHRLKKPLMTYATERHWRALAEKVGEQRARAA